VRRRLTPKEDSPLALILFTPRLQGGNRAGKENAKMLFSAFLKKNFHASL
jgi:hypothetical protein